MSLQSTFRRFLYNSSWLIAANGASMVCGFLQAVIVARLLGVRQYGMLALILAITASVYGFIESRVWEAAIRFVILFRESRDSARASATLKLCVLVDAVCASVAFVALIFSATHLSRWFMKDAGGANLLQLYAISLLITIPYSTCSALLRIGNHFDWLAYHSSVSAALRLAGALVVVLIGGGIKEVLYGYLIASFLSSVILLAMAAKTVKQLELAPWRLSPLNLLRGNFRRILKFMLFSNLNSTSRLITSRADALLLGWFTTPAVVGVYKLAKTLIEPLNMIGNSLYTALYPEISRLAAQADFRQIRSVRRKFSFTTALVIIPLCLLTTLAAPYLVPLFFGERFLGAVALTQIIVWQVIWVPFTWLPPLLLSLERTGTVTVLNYVDALVYLVLLLLLIPQFAALGAAWALLARFAVGIVVSLAVMARVEKSLAPLSVLRPTPN